MAATEARSPIQGEEIVRIAIGQGIYTSELPSNIPDGFSAEAFNLVATGDSLENRVGIRPSSVDYKVFSDGPPSSQLHYFAQLTFSDPTQPILAWATYVSDSVAGTTASTLNLIRGPGSGANDGYMQVAFTFPNDVISGICQYNDRIYFCISTGGFAGVYRITSINWATDAITYSSIPSSSGMPLFGLFVFKDRMWAWSGQNLFFTEIAATGGYPETWGATNYVNIQSTAGKGTIASTKPLSNKLIIHSQTGLHTLLVQGEPASWLLRLLDSDSISTHSQCCFESKGIMYYVNTQGVWATNGTQVTKLSGVIEDQFFLAKGNRFHTLHSYEDGMILSITKLTDTGHTDSPNCRIFYSKLEPISWTEWGIQAQDGGTNVFDISATDKHHRITQIHSVSRKVATFLSAEPLVYVLATVSDSTAASVQKNCFQLLIFDGGENVVNTRKADGTAQLLTAPVEVYFKTKYIDAGNPYSLKQNKEGLIELFTSDTQHKFTASWDFDSTVGKSSKISALPVQDFTVGVASNLIRLKSNFPFRRCAFAFSAMLQSNTSQIKVKDIAIRMDTGRSVAEKVQ